MKIKSARIGIVSVCYNSNSVLPNMLASIPKDVPVVLVNNRYDSENNVLVEMAKSHNATLISNKTNKGFGTACNQGAEILNKEFLLFLNPDAVLDPDALDALLKAADTFPSAVAFNPRIILPSGTPFFKRRSHLLPRSKKMARGWPKNDCEVSILSGAAMFVRRTIFMKAGGFDPAIFLFYEDDDLALRLHNQYGKLFFIRDSLVMHMSGKSSGPSIETVVLKAWHMWRSRVYATRKHGRPMPYTHAMISALSKMFLISTLFSKRNRAKQFAYLRGVISAWRL